MKTTKINILMFLSLVLLFAGCEKPFDFSKEQYENRVYLQSDNDEFNIYNRAIAKLDSEPDMVYLTVGVGGSAPTLQPIEVKVELLTTNLKDNKDTLNCLWGRYNKSKYDIDYKKWSRLLPKENYTIEDSYKVEGEENVYKVIIQSGEVSKSIPIQVRDLHKLSPDSLYMLDFKIISSSNGDQFINPKKQESLIPVYWKNQFSDTKKPAVYDLYGELGVRVSSKSNTLTGEKVITSNPTFYPISKNEIRVVAGNEKFDKNDVDIINKNSIVMIINNDSTLDFRQYNDSLGFVVEKVLPTDTLSDRTGYYNNKYTLISKTASSGTESFFRTFRAHYRYQTISESKKRPITRQSWTYCKVEMKIEYNPNDK